MVTKQFFNGTNGKMSFVKIEGQLAFPTIVFLDGFGGTSNYLGLKNIAKRIDHRFTKLFIDRLGICESDETTVPRTWENIIFELHELIHSITDQPVLFFTHSASGPLSLAYSSTYTNEVIGLIVVEPTTGQSEVLFQTKEYVDAIAWLDKLSEQERAALSIDPEWTEEDTLELQRTEKPFAEKTTLHNEYLSLRHNLECISKISIPSHLAILLFSQPFRENEYRSSEYAGNNTTFIWLEGHHHLHRLHPDLMANKTNNWLTTFI